jgi:NhaP-type Na+/H+ and K+/H+ antiporter
VTATRAAALLAAATGGAVTGLLGTYAHLLVVGSGRWPAGLLLALLLTAGVALTARALPLPTGAAGALVTGWLVVVVLAMSRRREGDLLIVQNGRGLAWLALGVVVLVGALVLPGGRRPEGEVRVTP